MANLKDVKKKLATVQPFITYEFRGQNDILMLDGIPLSVEVTPPSMSFILESGQLTTLILRYSTTYSDHLKQVSQEKGVENLEALNNRPEIAQQIMDEMRERIAQSDDEKSQMIGVIVKLGKQFLIHKAVYGYYKDETQEKQDKFHVQFTEDKEQADEWNERNAEDNSKMVIWIDSLDDVGLIQVGLRLMDALPRENVAPANIPIKPDKLASATKPKQGVIDTVPANSVASFPRDLRSLVVEDAPTQSGKAVGNTGENK